MKVVILAGGFGTRISEESTYKPKPMIEIGGMPILWHIMKCYSYYGFNEFVICAGYKQHIIKEWFANYYLYNSNITFDYTNGKNEVVIHKQNVDPWKVTVVDTGLNTMTGGRIKRIRDYVGEETFCMTYGDAVCDVDLKKVLEYHENHGKIATITSVKLAQNKGVLDIDGNDLIKSFREKSNDDDTRINGGFMVLEPSVFNYINGDDTIFERYPMEKLSSENELIAYKHDGFWQCMDTKREMEQLINLIESKKAPWIKW